MVIVSIIYVQHLRKMLSCYCKVVHLSVTAAVHLLNPLGDSLFDFDLNFC